MTTVSSPPSKRLKLEPQSTPKLDPNEDVSEDENHCSICLQVIDDQTVIPNCSHEFCFECLLIWTSEYSSPTQSDPITQQSWRFRAVQTLPIMRTSNWGLPDT